MAGAASARVTVNVGGGGLQPPPQAAAQGLTSLVFNEDFNSLSGIDMADSRQAGFNFYRFKPFGFGVLPTSDMSVSNSVLTINQATGGNDAGYAMGSTCGIGSNQFVGFTATGGGYFEARIANSATGSGGNGWPAFWSMSDDHLWQSVDVNFWEVDFYEKLGNVDQHVFAVHSWATP
jgi:hypothetical protein